MVRQSQKKECDRKFPKTVFGVRRSRAGMLPKRRAILPIIESGSPSWTTQRTFDAIFRLPEPKERALGEAKVYRNPMFLAQERQLLLDGDRIGSRASLARRPGVSRAHVTQVLRLLKLAPEVHERLRSLGDPTDGLNVGVHTLQSLTGLPAGEQMARVQQLIGRNGR